ncbi:MAG: UDP-N-acetylmuramoyl-tripeptide--D-alanyl-D-alanine ligase [Candidatus Niyogibacteria bacterium]|nr:UDP-N-acetylmuramoyl-tripeptide--D-alanyl-D-alanine ligase [Candidatus Niyogibacteria bacterium]
MFKSAIKLIITKILRIEAELVMKKYHPRVIAITGSVGKTSTKGAIAAVLSKTSSVRASGKSYNSELGVPLDILGQKTAWSSPIGWLLVLWNGFKQVFTRKEEYPKTLVLEMGVDRPGDIARMEDLVTPDIAVVTAIGEVPVHIEFFAGSEAVAREKAKILRFLGVRDWAILNFDDATVYDMKEKTRSQVLTFGFGEHADVRASNYQVIYQEDGGRAIPLGVSFKVDHQGATVPVRIHGVFGRQQVYAALAAIAVGLAEGMNLIEISEALSLYDSPPGRLKLIEGIKGAILLDDTYNSSPQALHAAIDTLRDIPAKRKIAVLGDMLELGKFTIEAHKEIGKRLKNIIDILLVVGPRSKFIAEEAREGGFEVGHIFEFSDSTEAGLKLQKIMEDGDLILVKGSQSMRMERVVEEVMLHPENADKLLVRQDAFWKSKK